MNKKQNPPTFETLIEDLGEKTQERLRKEFKRLSDNGRESFNKLFALAYEQGRVVGAEHVQNMIDEHKRRMARYL